MLKKNKKLLASFIIPILVVIYLEIFYNYFLINSIKYIIVNFDNLKAISLNFINNISLNFLLKLVFSLFQIGLFISLWDFRKSEIKREKSYLIEEKFMKLF